MFQLENYVVLDRGQAVEGRKEERVRLEDLLGMEALSNSERARLARLAEAMIVILQTMVDAARDPEDDQTPAR